MCHLRMHGVRGDHFSLKVQRLQQGLELRDLVGLVRDLALRDHHALSVAQCRKHVYLATVRAHRAPQHFAIHRDASIRLRQAVAGHPSVHDPIQRVAIHLLQSPTDRRFTGRLVGPGLRVPSAVESAPHGLGQVIGPLADRDETPRTTHNGRDRDGQD